MRLCTEDGAYVREPGWLKDLETAAAIAKLHDVVQASTAYDDTGTIGRRVSMKINRNRSMSFYRSAYWLISSTWQPVTPDYKPSVAMKHFVTIDRSSVISIESLRVH